MVKKDKKLDNYSFDIVEIKIQETFKRYSVTVRAKFKRSSYQLQFLSGDVNLFEKIVKENYAGRVWHSKDPRVGIFGYVSSGNAEKDIKIKSFKKV